MSDTLEGCPRCGNPTITKPCEQGWVECAYCWYIYNIRFKIKRVKATPSALVVEYEPSDATKIKGLKND